MDPKPAVRFGVIVEPEVCVRRESADDPVKRAAIGAASEANRYRYLHARARKADPAVAAAWNAEREDSDRAYRLRNNEMVRARLAGMTMAAIARANGVSNSRVAQILSKQARNAVADMGRLYGVIEPFKRGE